MKRGDIQGDIQHVFNILPFLSSFLFFHTLSSSEPHETFLSHSLNGSKEIILISPSFQFHLSPPSMFSFSPLSGITIHSFSLLKLFFSPLITLLTPPFSPPNTSGEVVRVVPWRILPEFKCFSPYITHPKVH